MHGLLAAAISLLGFGQAFGQRGAQCFEFINAALLTVNRAVQGVQQVFLSRQFDLDIDQAFFIHGFFLDVRGA
jgi:hypothetical protein